MDFRLYENIVSLRDHERKETVKEITQETEPDPRHFTDDVPEGDY